MTQETTLEKERLREQFEETYEQTDGTIGVGDSIDAAKQDATEYLLDEEGVESADDVLVQFYTPEADTETFIDEELGLDPNSVGVSDETSFVLARYTVDIDEDEAAATKSPGAPADESSSYETTAFDDTPF